MASIEARPKCLDLAKLTEEGFELVGQVFPLDPLRDAKELALLRRNIRPEVREKTAPDPHRLPHVEDLPSRTGKSVYAWTILGHEADLLPESLGGELLPWAGKGLAHAFVCKGEISWSHSPFVRYRIVCSGRRS